MSPYLLAFSLSVLLASILEQWRINSPMQRSLAIAMASIASLPTIFLVGFRKDVGTDYQSYVDIFKKFQNGASIWYLEPIYSLTNILIARISSDPWPLFLFCACLSSILVFYRIFRTSDIPWISIAVLFGLGFILMQTNHVRSTIAVAIIFYASPFLWKGHPTKWSSAAIAASGFHYTALAMIPMYWILRKKWHISVAIAIFGVALTISISAKAGALALDFAQIALPEKYSHYPERIIKNSDGYRIGFGFVAQILIAIAMLTLWKKLSNIDLRSRILANAFFFGVVGWIALYQFWAVGRISVYLLIFGTLFWPILVTRIRGLPEKALVSILIALFYATLFVTMLARSSHDTIPYQSIFS